MNKREKLFALAEGNYTGSALFSVWRHFPRDDADAMTLAKKTAEFYNVIEPDLVKVTPVGGFMAEAYGCRLTYLKNLEGTRSYDTRLIEDESDLEHVPALGESNLILARQILAVKNLRALLPDPVCIAQTVFSPLSVVRMLSGDKFREMLNSPKVQTALDAIAETTKTFALASIKAGAESVFYAIQTANSEAMDKSEYLRIGFQHDMHLIEELSGRSRFVIAHVHGRDPFIGLAVKFNCHALNWHDRKTEWTLRKVREITEKILMGGIDEETLSSGDESVLRKQVQDTISVGRSIMIAPGCVVPIDVKYEHLKRIAHIVSSYTTRNI